MWEVMLWHFILNLARQRALDFYEHPTLGDAVRRTTEKRILWVLHEPDFVGFLAVARVIQITGHWLEKSSVSRCSVSRPRRLEHLFAQEIIGAFVPVVTQCTGHVTCGQHVFTKGQPFRTSLIGVGSPQKFRHLGVHFV